MCLLSFIYMINMVLVAFFLTVTLPGWAGKL